MFLGKNGAPGVMGAPFFLYREMDALTMKRVSAILMVVIVGVAVFAQNRSAPPRLLVEKSVYDLGDVLMGEAKTIKVRIANAGGDTLRILQVVPSCGCTTAKMPKSALVGAESDIIEMRFNSQGFRGKTTKHVTIVTNDPSAPSTVVNFEANVVSMLELVPAGPLAFLGNVPMGIESTRTIKIRNAWKGHIAIAGITTTAPGVVISFSPKRLQPNDTLIVPVRVFPTKEGYTDGELIIRTGDKKNPEVRFKLGFNGAPSKPM